MSRFASALLLAGLLGMVISQFEAPSVGAQEPAKGKEKKKAAEKAKEAEKKDDDIGRVTLAFDPGSHTRPISAVGFNKDQSKLITVGMDYSIQIWSTSTGERLDILRLPPYGRDNGFDTDRWEAAAISADGNFVAIGGKPKQFWNDKTSLTRLLIVDLSTRRIRKYILGLGARTSITSLDFSANGDRLAVGTGGEQNTAYIIDDVIRLMKASEGKRPSPPRLLSQDFKGDVSNVALSPSGDRLLVSAGDIHVSSWNVAGKDKDAWKQLGEFRANHTDSFAWSPDESHFVRAWKAGSDNTKQGIELRDVECKQLKNWTMKELIPGFGRVTTCATIRYLAADRLFITALANLGSADSGGAIAVLLDPTTGKAIRRFEDATVRGRFTAFGAASATGDLAASTVSIGLDTVIYRLSDGKVVTRCGSRSPFPSLVAWSNDPKAPAVAWSDDSGVKRKDLNLDQLQYAFDLTKMEPMPLSSPKDFGLPRMIFGDWALNVKRAAGSLGAVTLTKGNDITKKPFGLGVSAATLIPNGDQPPLVAHAQHEASSHSGSQAVLTDADGKVLSQWQPLATAVRSMVSSPDGRYVLMTTGTQRVSIYRTDKSQFPFLNIVRVNGEWVAWTPEGYYAASPGGEKYIGWSVSNGANEFASYYPAERFAKFFRRPDIIQKAFEVGSLAEVLFSLDTKPAEIEKVLPPSAKLALVEQRGASVKLKATASSGSKDKPIQSMRLMLDGRPLPQGQGVWNFAKDQEAAAEIDFEIPGGLHEFKLLVKTEDGATISEPQIVKGPKVPGMQPTIHRVCIGVNDYDDPGLKLSSATKDAEAVFAALQADCVGPNNRFGAAEGELLLNKNASRERVKAAIETVRKKAKPGHLVVVFFAGHGIQKDKSFYLLTREADVTKDLEGNSISGKDLKDWLAEIECPVLLILDACHSAGAVKSFRPATDAATRFVTDDSVGVTVLSAAMQHEVAGATAENGYFTSGLLKGLKAGEGTPFDPYERQLYIHHLYSVVFSEVRNASGRKQNPFLNMPWTVPPLPVREVTAK